MLWLPPWSQAEQEKEGLEGSERKGSEEETKLRTTMRRPTKGQQLDQRFIHIDMLSARSKSVRQVSVNPFRGKETEAQRG